MTTSTSGPGNFFEDFEVGHVFRHAVPRTVTEGDMALYIALTGDRRPLHCAREFAQSLGYEREVVHDLLTFHMVFGRAVPDVSLNSPANLGYADVRFLRPVYPGGHAAVGDGGHREAGDVAEGRGDRLGAHEGVQPAGRDGAAVLPLGDGEQARP